MSKCRESQKITLFLRLLTLFQSLNIFWAPWPLLTEFELGAVGHYSIFDPNPAPSFLLYLALYFADSVFSKTRKSHKRTNNSTYKLTDFYFSHKRMKCADIRINFFNHSRNVSVSKCNRWPCLLSNHSTKLKTI